MPTSPPPLNISQHTLAAQIVARGFGLHSGESIAMALKPAPPNTGVQFIRTDICDLNNQIHANADQVIDTRRGTTLANCDGVKISTVEHVLAALLAHNIDNVLIEVNADEIPTMDGCSAYFSEKLDQVGSLAQQARRRFIKVLKPVSVQLDTSIAQISPHDRFEIDLGINYQNPLIGNSVFCFDVNKQAFINEIAPARTFALRSEIDDLQSSGKGAGGNLHNCIVVGADQIENEGGLRFEDEYVRHKVLDALGDLSLAGGFLLGRYKVRRAGHQINHLLVKTLLADPKAWEYASFEAN